MAGAESPAMASRTATSDEELKIKLIQWYERRIKETSLGGVRHTFSRSWDGYRARKSKSNKGCEGED